MHLLFALALAAAADLDGGIPPSTTAAMDGGLSAATDGGTSATDDAQLQLELESAMGKDRARAPARPGTQPGPSSATSDSPPPAAQNLARGSQSLNPDISAIVDADFGYQRRQMSFLAGDDPDLKSATGRKALGPLVQEVELALSAIVDPYFKGEVYLTIPNLSGLEVEEAFATTTSLPANLQVKVGTFRSAFGRQNGQHLHVQDFTRRPLINDAFLGSDGLRGAAAQVSWLVPLPFYLTLFGEVRRASAPDLPAPVGEGEQAIPPPASTFGGGTSADLTYVGAAKFQASEFARVRGYVEAEQANLAAGSGPLPAGQLIPTLTPGSAVAAFLQLEISIGAHGAHAF